MNAEQKQKIFNHFADNHCVLLLDNDFNEIESILDREQYVKERAIAFADWLQSTDIKRDTMLKMYNAFLSEQKKEG